MATPEHVALDNLREAVLEDESGLDLVHQLKAKQDKQAEQLRALELTNALANRHCDVMAQMLCRLSEFLTAHGHDVRTALGTVSTVEKGWLMKLGIPH